MKANHPLFKIAEAQSGLFTSHQAITAGVDCRNHAYHLKAGNWLRVEKGVYRLNCLPGDSRKELFFFQLWARNRRGRQVGVFSYETALNLILEEKAQTEKFHITVPVRFRRQPPCSDKLILYHEDLNSSEVIQIENLHTTSLKKTFQDLILRAYHPNKIKDSLKKCIDRKILSEKEIRTIPVPKTFQKVFDVILFELFG